MNTILEQINSAGYRFVEFALPMLVQSGVLITVLLLADLLLRKKVRAVIRYWLWMLILLKLILPTTLSSPISLGSWFDSELASIKVSDTSSVAQPLISPEIIETQIPAVTGVQTTVVETAEAPPAHNQPVVADLPVISPPMLTWKGIVFLIWIAVVAAMGLLLLQRVIFVRGLIAQAKQPTELMKDAFRFCCRQMALKSKVGLKVSANTASPAVCGLFRPVILVPENLAPTLGVGHLRTVLLHEIAHIKRGDLWINLAQTVLQIIYFYNPLLWLANHIIRGIREQAVDEAVQVAMGTKAAQYPQTLLDVAKTALKRPALSLRLIGVVESKSALKARIKRMLDRPVPKSAKLGIFGLVALIVVGFLLLPMARAAKSKKVNQNLIGKWRSVDFVRKIEDFTPGRKSWRGELVLKNVEFMKRGKTSSFFTWKKNWIYHENARAKAEIREFNGSRYLFLPWLSGDVTRRNRKPKYYVMKEVRGSKKDGSDFRAKLKEGITVEEGVGFDDIVIGNCTGEFIKFKLGKPDKEIKNEKGWWLVYHKKYGLDFWVNPEEDILIEIRLNKGFKGKLTSGISMSSNKQDIFYAYGQPIGQEITKDFDQRFDNQVLLFREPSGSELPHIAKIRYDDHGLLFWFDGTELNQIVVYQPVPSQDSDEFKAILPNGVTAELVGVCEHPSQDRLWWGPDGTTLRKKPYNKPTNFQVVPGRDKQVREIAVQLQGNLGEGIGFRYEIPVTGNSASAGVIDTYKEGELIKTVYGVAFDAPVASEAADISIGIGAGPWQTVASSEADFQGTKSSYDIVWHQPAVEIGKTIITVAHSYKDENVRIAARTKDNAIHASGSTGSSVAGSESIRATFEVPLSEIKEFLFQMRPYQWVKFSNVSLRPGRKTNVQVEMRETGEVADKDKTPSENSEQLSEAEKQQLPDINAKKRQIAAKLQALMERRDNVQMGLDMAERSLREVRQRWDIYDLEERSYPHPLTERLNRLQREKDELVLEISQHSANLKNLEKKDDDANLVKAEEYQQELNAKLEALENMLQEAEARKRELDLARTQYKQRAAVRDERLQRLNELKSQIEKLTLIYDAPDAFDSKVEVEKKVHRVKFRPQGKFNPRTAKQLLDAFNDQVRFRVTTHHFRTAVEDDKLMGYILTDSSAEQKAIKLILDSSDNLEFVSAGTLTEDELAEHYAMEQSDLSSPSPKEMPQPVKR